MYFNQVRQGKLATPIPLSLTLPSRFADGLDDDMHGHILFGSLLTTVEGCHHNLVALLLVEAQPLRVPNVT